MRVKQITKLKEIRYKKNGDLAYVCRAIIEPDPKRPYMEFMFVSVNDDGTVQTVGFPSPDLVDLEEYKRGTEFTDNDFNAHMVHMQVKPLLDDCEIIEDGPVWLNIYNL